MIRRGEIDSSTLLAILGGMALLAILGFGMIVLVFIGLKPSQRPVVPVPVPYPVKPHPVRDKCGCCSGCRCAWPCKCGCGPNGCKRCCQGCRCAGETLPTASQGD